MGIGDWGLGIGDWGLGIGDWGLGPIPNPQSPIPNPQSPIPIKLVDFLKQKKKIKNNLSFYKIIIFYILFFTKQTKDIPHLYRKDICTQDHYKF